MTPPCIHYNGTWVDGNGQRIKTYSELYLEAVDKDNRRVGVEWDAIGAVSGSDDAAIKLAELQGNRSMKLAIKYGHVGR